MSTPSQSPNYNYFDWKDITFQVAQFDQYDNPAPKTPRSHTSLYTTTIIASPQNKLKIKVQNNSSQPARLSIRIKAKYHTDYKIIILEKNSFQYQMVIAGDCFIELMHVDRYDLPNKTQTFDNFLFHVMGIDENRILFSDQHYRDVKEYHFYKNIPYP